MLIDPNGNPSIPFTLFAMEQEGEIDSVAGKRNKIIKNLKQRPQWEVDEFAVRQEFLEVGLYNPTDKEVEEILREANGY